MRDKYSSVTCANIFYTLRDFLKYCATFALNDYDLASLVTGFYSNPRETLPSHYSKEETTKLLQSIDRSTPTGRKEYLMIFFAVRLGIRALDILRLTMDNIRWEQKTIVI